MSSLSTATPLVETESTLKVGLQAVLRSLDVGLEDELTRYRRKKHAQVLADMAAKKSLARTAQSQGNAGAVASAETVSAARAAIAKLAQTTGTQLPKATEVAQAGGTQAIDSAASPSTASPSTASPATAGAAAAAGIGAVPLQSSLVTLDSEAAAGSADGAADGATASAAVGTATDAVEASDDSASEDYFASSAALLETLTTEESELEAVAPAAPNRLSKLMTPVGIGSSMLLLLGSATGGYLLLNPESLSHLQFSKLVPQKSSNTVLSQAAVTPVDAELPPGAPDLSQKEFVDLTLSNLGSLSLDELGNPSTASSGLTGTVASLPAIPAQSPTVAPVAVPNAVPNAVPGAAVPTNGVNGNAVAGGGGAAATTASTVATRSGGLLANLANAVAGSAPMMQMAPATPLPSVLPAPAGPAVQASAPALPIADNYRATVQAPAEPAYEDPAYSEPAYEEPAYEEPAYEEPSYSEPAYEEPAYSEPAYEEPAYSGPAYEEPAYEEPAAEVAVAPAEVALPEPEVVSTYGTFVVVTPYNSDLTLSQVQQIVPDAFVENADGRAFIQAGIFDESGTAQSLVDQLQREGVNATVEEY